MTIVQSIEELDAIYGKPSEPSIIKEVPRLIAEYQAIIEASPMMMLATSGPEGLDCTPRGDRPGFVRVVDDRTLMVPDRRGNNRVDSLRNIIRDPRVATLFLIPGIATTLRVNGKATITTDSAVLDTFAVEGKPPRSVIVIDVETAFFHCGRAMLRSGLWDPSTHVEASSVPSAGQILAALSNRRIDGEEYDEQWPERARDSLW
ncbi:pyridoxamine 5'-phosphate oxidase family protein [Gilvimarinus sp. F26214L]|uniref:pyridoxamine 5'-phosphate oxidase family protein n=1 Tax=Gilvimarinus sp. DZF01 TaxID=3461371 RepID=UPI004045B22D